MRRPGAGSVTSPRFLTGVVTGILLAILVTGLASLAARRHEPSTGTDTRTTSSEGKRPESVGSPTPTVLPPGPARAGTTRPASTAGRLGTRPNGERVTCPAATTQVSDSRELREALTTARPGDSIALSHGRYDGEFVATTSGTPEKPIYLCGDGGAVLDAGGITGGYAFHLDGASYWRLVGFTVRNAQKGVVADGVAGSVLQDLTVAQIGDEGIHLRSNSTGNAVLDNRISGTGLRRDTFGEGVYVGSAVSNWGTYSNGEPDRSDHNLVQGNVIRNTGAESVDIKEGTTGGAVIGNTFDGSGMTGPDSWVDVKGNGWLLARNVGRNSPKDGYQTHHITGNWGRDNVFTGNTADMQATASATTSTTRQAPATTFAATTGAATEPGSPATSHAPASEPAHARARSGSTRKRPGELDDHQLQQGRDQRAGQRTPHRVRPVRDASPGESPAAGAPPCPAARPRLPRWPDAPRTPRS